MKCENCEFKNHNIECFGESHTRLCILKNKEESYKDQIYFQTTGSKRTSSTKKNQSEISMKCQFCPFINNKDLVCTGPIDRIGHECKGEVVPEISTFKKVKNVIGAFVKEAKEGVPISQAQIDERMRICEACELFNHEKQQCSLCSCYMKIKTTLSTASCPLDPPKWGPILD